MKGLLVLSLSLLVYIQGTFTQDSSLSLAIDALPHCALICLATGIEDSPCSATNQTCICNNAPLQKNVTLCVTSSCTIKESLFTKNFTETTCGAPVRDKSGLYNNISIILGCISGAVVAVRLSSKWFTHADFGLDDYFIAITLAAGIPSSVLTVHGLTSNGLGRDIWTVNFEQITNFIHVFYVMEILYFAQVALLKLSLLFFYLKIFPGPTIRKLIWGTIAFDVMFGVVFSFVGIFQCRPISFYWKSWDGEHQGKCVDVNALGWANAVISILLDGWMLALPMSQIVHLKLHWKKKIGVALMFIVGTFVTIVSILRLQSLVHFAKSINPTWDNFLVSQWSTIEINIGIICACMPSMRLLLVHLFPKFLNTTQNKSSSKFYGNGSNSRVGASPYKSSNSSKPGESGIVFSKSYTVQYGNQWENDETSLVVMDDLASDKSNSRIRETLPEPRSQDAMEI